MTAITPVGPNIPNFEVPVVIAVISSDPNFQVPGVIKPVKSGVIVTLSTLDNGNGQRIINFGLTYISSRSKPVT